LSFVLMGSLPISNARLATIFNFKINSMSDEAGMFGCLYRAEVLTAGYIPGVPDIRR
jgi:hypothetical protein